MLIIPAIDLKGGRCVRLWQGEEDKETVYSEDPLAVARMWVKKGAQRLHIVDLDGAFRGRPVHLDIVEKIAREVDVPIEFGGGIREKAILDDVFTRGVDYAILGTRALSFDFVRDACLKFEDKIIISIDTRQDRILAEGWKKESSLKAEELVKGLVGSGVKTIIFTDITRDGTLRGVNIKLIQEFLEIADVKVIIAGGVASLADIMKLAELGGRRPAGVIIGKALYDGRVKLEEALAVGGQ
ncbi:1-(5-phosphoribosyl)-5-[(5-phosphoribosylamino)methylideneamino]imidazole-4-carboxamide isomerase [Candidatus Aerophobetes bacterium Ae_b3a]|nr:MAG: 1-(5-phosphoribosyl)-5-[(5-phosphoribosylamino)methylideneamino]imidazole-4-carboxamide isomerase [Candidatus Aerophobetes bacterium Ae_b3a]